MLLESRGAHIEVSRSIQQTFSKVQAHPFEIWQCNDDTGHGFFCFDDGSMVVGSC
jgi:hypothetical protein